MGISKHVQHSPGSSATKSEDIERSIISISDYAAGVDQLPPCAELAVYIPAISEQGIKYPTLPGTPANLELYFHRSNPALQSRSLTMHTSPIQQTQPLFSHPEARFYTASSIASSSSNSSASHGYGGIGHGPTLDHPLHSAHTHSNPVWKLVHTHDAIYAPVPPSLVRKRPALLSARSSSSYTSTASRSSSPWYDYDEFNDHPQSQRISPASAAGQRSSSPSQ